jgi:hypothetical protein
MHYQLAKPEKIAAQYEVKALYLGRTPSAKKDGYLRAKIYKRGAKITGWPAVPLDGGTRGVIQSQSFQSRMRASFEFENCTRDWGYMLTLTYRVPPGDHVADRKKMCRAVAGEFDDMQWGWIFEYQKRAVPHYHLFFELDAIERSELFKGSELKTIFRRGKETQILKGDLEDFFVNKWTRIANDYSIAFSKFQNGGILEKLRTPDAAARYIAKEAGKRAQKALPEGAKGCCRWWWLSDIGRGEPCEEKILESWPFPDKKFSLIFDKSLLRFRDEEPD